MDANSIKAMLVNSSYTFSSSHEFLSSVTAGEIARSSAFSSKTTTNGTFDAADITFTSVPTGDTIVAVVIYDDTPATDATKQLLAFIDHDSGGSAISQATNGGDITLQFNASGIFSI